MSRRFHIRTFGCQMNEHDSERMSALLEADGMEATEDVEAADVVVLNTCCIRENADNRLYGHLGHLASLKARRPEVKVVVGGCLAQKDRDLVQRRARHVDVVLGTHNVGRLTELIHESDKRGPVLEVLDQAVAEDEPFLLAASRKVAHAAWVTVQVGCNNSCSFCIVPSVRGKEASRPFGELLGEVEALAAEGVCEITLLGQNVNSYGRDITTALRGSLKPHGEDDAAEAVSHDALAHAAGPEWASGDRRKARPLFADLLRSAGAVDGIDRVRFTSPHPKDLRPETIAAMADTKEVCEHLHLPLQAGSDRVLSQMRRGYTAARYLERLRAARHGIPDLAVTSDLIVGFPGETEREFQETLEVVAEAELDSAYTFIFSPRPGTRAAEMTERFVPADVVADRFARLRVVVERSALAKHRGRVGGVEEVLVEGPSKRDPEMVSGRTRQSKLVHFPWPKGGLEVGAPAGAMVSVSVTGAAPHHLTGRMIEVLRPPRPPIAVRERERHRRELIPLAAH